MSISIPRKVKQVAGPSHLCSVIGMPRYAHASLSIPYGLCTVRVGGAGNHNKLVQIVEDVLDASLPQVPLEHICYCINFFWS